VNLKGGQVHEARKAGVREGLFSKVPEVRVLLGFLSMAAIDPEVRSRIESTPDVFRGILPAREIKVVAKMEDEFSGGGFDPAGKIWAGCFGIGRRSENSHQ